MSDRLLLEILGELKGVRGELTDVRSELTSLNQRVSSLEDGQKRLENRMNNLEEGQGRLESHINSLEKSQELLALEIATVKADVNDVKTNLVKFENNVTPKIKILFDAHSIQMEYNASIKNSQARIEESIYSLRYKLLEQEQEIRLLQAEAER